MSIVLEQLTKRYAGSAVVHQLSLEVAEGELLVLLGPSGSGKSTVLRMIAGLTEVDAGRISLRGRDVTHLAPQKRGVGLVFQHYALFRTQTVAENVEFPLAIRRVPRAERKRRREELLELVGLAGLGARLPRELSGGQQQRVALARALAHRPEVLLLDEPFGALDAKIRTELRRTIREIQRELGIATIFVTHDQDEAFELADRVAVMHWGRLLEIGPPRELYLRPETEFVATFLGTANLLVGESTPRGVRLGEVELPLSAPSGNGLASAAPRRIQVLFRPEDVVLATDRASVSAPLWGRGVVERTTFVGASERLRLRLPPLANTRAIAPAAPFGADHILVEASRSQHLAERTPLAAGDEAWIGVRHVHALAHPGLSVTIVAEDTATPPAKVAEAALDLGAEIARRAHARVTVLGLGAYASDAALREVRERLGGGFSSLDSRIAAGEPARALAEEAERRPFDLALVGIAPAAKNLGATVETALGTGDHHLLVVRGPASLPERLLICVAVGEPGKGDVLFAGRLARHLGAQATVLTVLGEGHDEEAAERFLAASVRSLAALGVAARSRIARFEGDLDDGEKCREVLAELADTSDGFHDLLVLGAPLADLRGRIAIGGVVLRLLENSPVPVLVVRSDPTEAVTS